MLSHVIKSQHIFIDNYLYRIIIIIVIIFIIIITTTTIIIAVSFCTLEVLTINQSLLNTIITLYNYYNWLYMIIIMHILTMVT